MGVLAIPFLLILLWGGSVAFGWITSSKSTPQEALEASIAITLLQRNQRKRKGRIHYTYELRVQRPDGSTRHLMGAGFSPEEVLFLERMLESRLGIEDRAVPGDFKPEGSA